MSSLLLPSYRASILVYSRFTASRATIPCVHRHAAPKSTASGVTVSSVAKPQVVTCDIRPSMTSSNGPWRQRTSLPCWNQNRCPEMMENFLTAWPHSDCTAMGERSLLSVGFHVSGHPSSQSLEPFSIQFNSK